MESSLCEKPERHASRRLSDHLTVEGQKQKVHSLVDKVYARKNLHLAWERVRANRGASGTDRITIEEFEANLEANLERLHRELRDDTYQPLPVRRLEIPKRGAPGKTRPLGIPSIYDRVCQQALANRLEPIFEKVFDPSSFGYRKGRQTADEDGRAGPCACWSRRSWNSTSSIAPATARSGGRSKKHSPAASPPAMGH